MRKSQTVLTTTGVQLTSVIPTAVDEPGRSVVSCCLATANPMPPPSIRVKLVHQTEGSVV